MFTGLIETVGTLSGIHRRGGGAFLTLCVPGSWTAVQGESIAVQGACLTVNAIQDGGFSADVLEETLSRTNLGDARAGQALNLERALRVGDRLGGHFVTGHVDALGTIEDIRRYGDDRVLRIRCGPGIAAGIVEKGSIALDGISLTVADITPDAFEVCIIPWTWSHTSLRERAIGDTVNLETDLIGKYIQRGREVPSPEGVSTRLLAEAGFLAGDA